MNKKGMGRHIVFTGVPGCGKGTQARILKEKLSIPHLSTGEMLRQEMMEFIKNGDDPATAMDKARGQYGRTTPEQGAVKLIDPRKE